MRALFPSLSQVWIDVVDFVIKSQVKTEEDREYLRDDNNDLAIQTFCSRRELRCCDFSTYWLKENCLTDDIALTDKNQDYHDTNLVQPWTLNDLVKELYRLYNTQADEERSYKISIMYHVLQGLLLLSTNFSPEKLVLKRSIGAEEEQAL